MTSGLHVILISNLATILVTATVVLVALHFNPSSAGDILEGRTLQEEHRHLQNEGECCDCDTGEFIPPPGFEGLCFSASTTVELENGKTATMKNLRIGDRILVSNGKYEPIYSFGHFDTSVNKAEFLQIRTASTNGALEMTPNHLIFKEGNEVVPASSLRVGDKVLMGSGAVEDIVSIQKATQTGAFAPFTPSGKIITNGIQTSCFATIQEGQNRVTLGAGLVDLPLTYHQLGLVFESPHRLYCHLVAKCSDTYNEDGMSHWVEMPLQQLEWILQQNAILSGFVFFVAFLLLVVVGFLEVIAMHPIALVIALMIPNATKKFFPTIGKGKSEKTVLA